MDKRKVKDIKIWEVIYWEPEQWVHIDLHCEQDEGEYKVFSYKNYDWSVEKVKISNEWNIQLLYDNLWHVCSDTEVNQ